MYVIARAANRQTIPRRVHSFRLVVPRSASASKFHELPQWLANPDRRTFQQVLTSPSESSINQRPSSRCVINSSRSPIGRVLSSTKRTKPAGLLWPQRNGLYRFRSALPRDVYLSVVGDGRTVKSGGITVVSLGDVWRTIKCWFVGIVTSRKDLNHTRVVAKVGNDLYAIYMQRFVANGTCYKQAVGVILRSTHKYTACVFYLGRFHISYTMGISTR